jgi:hypothetical protein
MRPGPCFPGVEFMYLAREPRTLRTCGSDLVLGRCERYEQGHHQASDDGQGRATSHPFAFVREITNLSGAPPVAREKVEPIGGRNLNCERASCRCFDASVSAAC